MSFEVWREIAAAYNGKIIKEWERRNVRHWHKADIPVALHMAAEGNADMTIALRNVR